MRLLDEVEEEPAVRPGLHLADHVEVGDVAEEPAGVVRGHLLLVLVLADQQHRGALDSLAGAADHPSRHQPARVERIGRAQRWRARPPARVVGPEGAFSDLERAPVGRFRLGIAPESPVEAREVVEAPRNVGVVGPQGVFADLEGPPVEGLCLGEAPQVPADDCLVAEASGDIGVVGPEGAFADPEGPEVERLRLGPSPLGPGEDRQVAQASGDVGMIGPESTLPDFE